MSLIIILFLLLIIIRKNRKIESLFYQIITNEKVYELTYVPPGLELIHSVKVSFKKINNLIKWMDANREKLNKYWILEIPKINGNYPKWIDEKECEDYGE